MDRERKMILNAKKDINQFDYLYSKYYPRINSFIFHRVKEESVRNEIVSNVFFKAMKRLAVFRFYDSRNCGFSSWLYRIALSELSQYFYERKREKRIHDNFEWNLPIGKPIKIDYSIVEKFMVELKLDAQNLISLRFYEKLSYNEIGEILKKKESTVKVQMHRILKKLRKKIEREIDHERS
ncbi:MAG: sigma-70 family RNA polymerase sigma factor [Candidatus Tenebribacter burtonii]|nr:sigma-70 family RNA polymerase sigma factor [Candidatus Tenebribacter burtonii]